MSLSCPKCKGTKWFEGPCGGGSQNILCASCHTEYCDGGPFGLDELKFDPSRLWSLYGIVTLGYEPPSGKRPLSPLDAALEDEGEGTL